MKSQVSLLTTACVTNYLAYKHKSHSASYTNYASTRHRFKCQNNSCKTDFCLSSTIKAPTKKRATKGPHILRPSCTNHTLKTLQPTDSSKTKMSFSNLLLTKKPLINFMQNYFPTPMQLKTGHLANNHALVA